MKKINIAFDGPAASGKSTVAKAVAKKLNYLYIDTGAMYRAVTWLVLKHGVDISDHKSIETLAAKYPITLISDYSIEKGYRVVVDNTDITEEITSPDVNRLVSPVAAISEVRKILVSQQKLIAADGGVVMAGRDITTVVIPDAELKIYLDASLEERAERRFKEERGRISIEETRAGLAMRDRIDSGREDSPLTISPDAVIIDSTGMTIDAVVSKIINLAHKEISNQ